MKIEEFKQFGVLLMEEEESLDSSQSIGQEVLDICDAQYDAVIEKYSNQTRPSGVHSRILHAS